MLVVFTGVVAAVMEVTLRFMGEAECPVDVTVAFAAAMIKTRRMSPMVS